MMKARVVRNLNIRTGVPELHPYNLLRERYYRSGDIIDVATTVIGQAYKGNNVWYQLEDGCYVWSGGVEEGVTTKQLLSTTGGNVKISFKWFKDLNIETIWETFKEKGENATVAILDTGLDIDNPDLGPSINDNDKKVIIDYPGSQKYNSIEDLQGHGTRCASIVGGRNLFQHNVGIAPECRLLIGKISCKKELRDPNYILSGIEWSLDKGAEVISISYGIQFSTDLQKKSFQEKIRAIIKNKKVLIFASAGNNNNQNTNEHSFGENFPASFPECISVGASDNGKFSPITLQSDQTIIHAPGINIESYGLDSILSPESGTSFSTPIVAGITALGISYYKKINHDSWDPKQIVDALYKSSSTITGNKKLIEPLQFLNILRK